RETGGGPQREPWRTHCHVERGVATRRLGVGGTHFHRSRPKVTRHGGPRASARWWFSPQNRDALVGSGGFPRHVRAVRGDPWGRRPARRAQRACSAREGAAAGRRLLAATPERRRT